VPKLGLRLEIGVICRCERSFGTPQVADLQWTTVKEEDKQNQELLELSNQILKLTREVHAHMTTRSSGTGRST